MTDPARRCPDITRQDTADSEITVPSAHDLSEVPSFTPGVSHNVALYALSAPGKSY